MRPFADAFLLVLVFLILYGPRLKMLDMATTANAVLALFGLLFVDFGSLRKIVLDLCLAFCVIGLIFFLHSALFASPDNTSYMIMLKYCMYVLSTATLVVFAYRTYGYHFLSILIRMVAFATVINCLFVLFFFSFPDMAFVAGLFLDYGEQANWVEAGHRAFDVSIGGGAVASFVFSSVLFVYLVSAQEFVFKKIEVIFVVTSILIGMAITGRTGIFIFILQISLYALFSVKVVTLRLVIAASFLTFIFVLSVFYLKDHWVSFSVWFDWYFEWINNYLRYGEASSRSTDVIKDMYFFPDDLLTIFVGEANFGRHPQMPYVPSDIGYVRAVFGVGVIGAVAIYSVYLFPMWSSFMRIVSYNMLIMLMLFSLGYMLFNMKEMYIAGRAGSQLFFLIFLGFFLYFERCGVCGWDATWSRAYARKR